MARLVALRVSRAVFGAWAACRPSPVKCTLFGASRIQISSSPVTFRRPAKHKQTMRPYAYFVSIAALLVASNAFAQEGPLKNDPPKGITPEQIIQKFADKEKEFKLARDWYTFRQDVKVQTLDGKTVTGEYHEPLDVTSDDQHRRLEPVVFAPQRP